MTKCPKCNYNLSSSDVLCPKCGALVEEINTTMPPNRPITPTDTEQSSSESASVPDHYENIILYNESFSMIDSEPPEEKLKEFKQPVEEPEEFDIENILTSNGDAKHVNPLLAHIEKQRHDQEAGNIAEDVPDTQEPKEALPGAKELEEVLSEDEEPAQDAKELKPAEDAPPVDKSYEGDLFSPAEEEFADEAAPSVEEPAPVDVKEFEDIVKEIAPADEEKQPADDGIPADGIPAYSKSYLDAIRNIDSDNEHELEEEFDPEAFMEKFKSEQAQEEPEPEPKPAAPQEPEEPAPQEPPRRRYNPNKPKPKYTEEELAVAARLAKEVEEARKSKAAQEQADNDTAVDKETVAAKEDSVVKDAVEEQIDEEPAEQETAEKDNTKKKKEKKKKKEEEEEILELELDSSKFFVGTGKSDENEIDERFVVEEDESDEPAEKAASKTNEFVYNSKDEESISSSKIAPLRSSIISSSSKRLPVWASVLIWLAVTAGLFFGAYMFDKYVKTNFGSYNDFVYEITDGNLDIDNIFN